MDQLKKSLIECGEEHPDLRSDLKPVLDHLEKEAGSRDNFNSYVRRYMSDVGESIESQSPNWSVQDGGMVFELTLVGGKEVGRDALVHIGIDEITKTAIVFSIHSKTKRDEPKVKMMKSDYVSEVAGHILRELDEMFG